MARCALKLLEKLLGAWFCPGKRGPLSSPAFQVKAEPACVRGEGGAQAAMSSLTEPGPPPGAGSPGGDSGRSCPGRVEVLGHAHSPVLRPRWPRGVWVTSVHERGRDRVMWAWPWMDSLGCWLHAGPSGRSEGRPRVHTALFLPFTLNGSGWKHGFPSESFEIKNTNLAMLPTGARPSRVQP